MINLNPFKEKQNKTKFSHGRNENWGKNVSNTYNKK